MVLGILAHVDAGKTTLSESILYHSSVTRKMGRVDHGDSYLDTDAMERKRGITIYSKEAVFPLGEKKVYLLDTPGHVDFSAEMERTLQVLDYAILVISGPEGVQAHTATLWRLLSIYNIPVFIFVNKMDQAGTDRLKIMTEIKRKLSGSCLDFSDRSNDDFLETVAMTDENTLEWFMNNGTIENVHICQAIDERKIFPCYFGSALKDVGVENFMEDFSIFTTEKIYSDSFKARVFKVARDASNNRLTYMKIIGGNLKVKSVIKGISDQPWTEKVDQIRVYSGEKYETVNEAGAGTVCAVAGLTKTCPGQLIAGDMETQDSMWNPVLEPVLMYRVIWPENIDAHIMLGYLKQLEEENPELGILWNEKLGEISVRVMGPIQIEILRSVILDRFNINVEFGAGSIVYKETIKNVVEGVGHYEPLRHYAEVHVVMEPLERGKGIIIDTKCSEDMLGRNWQRLIATHLKEREHPGVLTGSPITDVKITVTGGRAHQKHTEGGDFRQATYRAVRQGLKEAESVLLEPYYTFRLEVPSENVGRAINDIQKMSGTLDNTEADGAITVLKGRAPVSLMADYHTRVAAYTKGKGRLFLESTEYDLCHNSEEIITEKKYDSETDMDNPTGSVFCAHGAGFYVPWNEVKKHMHVESTLNVEGEKEKYKVNGGHVKKKDTDYYSSEKELKEIFEKTYGTYDRYKAKNPYKKKIIYSDYNSGGKEYQYKGNSEKKDDYLLVDGYNIIFSWDELNELSKVSIDGARMRLQEILCNYQGYMGCNLILVFDAYKVENHKESIDKYKNIYVVYTKEAETADQYIEKTVHNIGKKYNVTVATSDRLEQTIILGEGASRMSAQGFKEEIERVSKQIRNYLT